MKKIKKPSKPLSISERIITGLASTKEQKIVDLVSMKNARVRGEELMDSIVSNEKLSRLDPLHAAYAYGQNMLSVFVEQLTELPELSELAGLYADAEDEYMPSGPPMSPLTRSYFTCWGCFDLCAGAKKETFGTIAIDICKALGADAKLIRIFEKMQASRMGFYVHEGFSGRHVLLRELINGKRLEAVAPSGHRGQPGEIWLARIMPDPFEEVRLGYWLVFTTPYVIGKVAGGYFNLIGDALGWEAFFNRALENTGEPDKVAAYEKLMKSGLDRHYWNEYIFEAYVSHTNEAVWLTGFPDIPLSRPHSRESQRNLK